MTEDHGQQIRRLASEYAGRTGMSSFTGVEHRGPGAPSLYLFAAGGPFTSSEEALGYMRTLLSELPPPDVPAGPGSVPVNDHEYDEGWEAFDRGDWAPGEIAAQSASFLAGFRAAAEDHGDPHETREQRSSMERTAIRDPRASAITYAVTGPAGAVSLTVPDPLTFEHVAGALDVHSRTPRGLALTSCEVLPEGQCWPDGSFRGGTQAFKLYCAAGEDALYGELEAWYEAQLADRNR